MFSEMYRAFSKVHLVLTEVLAVDQGTPGAEWGVMYADWDICIQC